MSSVAATERPHLGAARKLVSWELASVRPRNGNKPVASELFGCYLCSDLPGRTDVGGWPMSPEALALV